MAFRSAKILVKTWVPKNNPHDQKPIAGTNLNESYVYGVAALTLIATGTLVWAFGDLLS
jgi:hypothetical protein